MGHWFDGQRQQLEAAAAAGLSARAIAVRYGCTRAAVSHKCRHWGIDLSNKGGGKSHVAHTRLRSTPYPDASKADLRIPKRQRKKFFDLTDACCRWPVGEVGTPSFFFCGGVAVEGKSYCYGHAKRAYAGLPSRRM